MSHQTNTTYLETTLEPLIDQFWDHLAMEGCAADSQSLAIESICKDLTKGMDSAEKLCEGLIMAVEDEVRQCDHCTAIEHESMIRNSPGGRSYCEHCP